MAMHPTLRYIVPAAIRTVFDLIKFFFGVIAIIVGFVLVAREHKRGDNIVSGKKSTNQNTGLALMAVGTIVSCSVASVGLVCAMIAYLAWK